MGHRELWAKVFPTVEYREVRGDYIDGYLNRKQLAEILKVHPINLSYYITKERLFLPDFYNGRSFFFREDRIEELKEKWANRLGAFPDSAPVKGVTTSFGLMLPRVKPKKEVLERLMQERPKRRSRDGSWRTRKHYNLNDLKS